MSDKIWKERFICVVEKYNIAQQLNIQQNEWLSYDDLIDTITEKIDDIIEDNKPTYILRNEDNGLVIHQHKRVEFLQEYINEHQFNIVWVEYEDVYLGIRISMGTEGKHLYTIRKLT